MKTAVLSLHARKGGGPWFADDASIIEAVHASLHQLGLGVFSPSFWSDEKECVAAMVAGCGCLIPSSPCLPFALFFLLPASSFAHLSDVHHVLLCECDFRKCFW
jgi:hypothetical protein